MKEIERSFIYGVSVSGDNFTDREKETRRLKANFENGLNVILISPRRMGKTPTFNRLIIIFSQHFIIMQVEPDIRISVDILRMHKFTSLLAIQALRIKQI